MISRPTRRLDFLLLGLGQLAGPTPAVAEEARRPQSPADLPTPSDDEAGASLTQIKARRVTGRDEQMRGSPHAVAQGYAECKRSRIARTTS